MIKYFDDVEQGTQKWAELRCGILTASEMKLIITPTLKVASNEKERSHLYELMAQRITGYVEPTFVSDDMLRGQGDEILARELYSKNYAPVTECGFVLNTHHGFKLGYSPDGLVGDEGQIEIKSRRQKYQIETIIECMVDGKTPDEYMIQVQTGLLATKRKWCDYVTYCGGLHMATYRIFPDFAVQEAIVRAGQEFERRMADKMATFANIIASPDMRLIPTERAVEEEMVL